MHAHGSVTVWLERLKDGSAGEAVDRLWHGYFRRLVELARGRLRARPRGIADEEDVALTAFDSFVRAVQAGRFPRLVNREMVDLEDLTDPEECEQVQGYVRKHLEYTGSARARHVLDHWETLRPKFVKVMPVDYRRALEEMKKKQAAAQQAQLQGV